RRGGGPGADALLSESDRGRRRVERAVGPGAGEVDGGVVPSPADRHRVRDGAVGGGVEADPDVAALAVEEPDLVRAVAQLVAQDLEGAARRRRNRDELRRAAVVR